MTTAIAPPCAIDCPDAIARFALDGQAPDFVSAPDCEDACREMMRWAARERVALVPVGGATELQVGNPLQAGPWCAVSTERLSGVVDYSPADLTVIARAGTTLADLDALLRASGQWLPYDVADPERATIGGLAAANRQGLLRAAFGAPRDRMLGLRVALADGSIVRTGGRTVKNVAGYDLTKLFAGSRGTLGLITEVTIRTAAIPAERHTTAYEAPDVRVAAEAALAVVAARLDPLRLAVTGGTTPKMHVGLAGNAERVAWQRRAIEEIVRAYGASPAAEPGGDPPAVVVGCPVQARCVVHASDVPAFLERMEPACRAIVADAASGVVEAAFADTTHVPEVRREMQAALLDAGWLVWTRLPAEAKRDGDVWHPVPASVGVMRALKRALDPDRLFSPGRFMGRL